MESPSIRDSSHPRQQIRQPVFRQNHPPARNPTRTDKVADRKHRNRFDIAAVLIFTFGNPNPRPVSIGDLRRNLVALLCPSFIVCVLKLGKLAPLKTLAVSKRLASFRSGSNSTGDEKRGVEVSIECHRMSRQTLFKGLLA